MTRYIKQRPNRWVCGPLAIVNGMKWLGRKVTSKDIPKVSEACKRENGHGIYDYQLSAGLKYFNVKYKVRRYATLAKIDDELNRGRAVIVTVAHKQSSGKNKGKIFGHYVLLIGKTEKTYTIVNKSTTCQSLGRCGKNELQKSVIMARMYFPPARIWALMNERIL